MDVRMDAYLHGFGVGLVFAGLFSLWLGVVASIATVIVGAGVILAGYYVKYFA